MKFRNILFATLLLAAFSCDSNRSNTEADREATYVHEGDTINPTEGTVEGTTGQKYMETASPDSTKEIEQ